MSAPLEPEGVRRDRTVPPGTPLPVVGMFTTFIVWTIASIAVAVEILFMLLPWSLGLVDEINVCGNSVSAVKGDAKASCQGSNRASSPDGDQPGSGKTLAKAATSPIRATVCGNAVAGLKSQAEAECTGGNHAEAFQPGDESRRSLVGVSTARAQLIACGNAIAIGWSEAAAGCQGSQTSERDEARNGIVGLRLPPIEVAAHGNAIAVLGAIAPNRT